MQLFGKQVAKSAVRASSVAAAAGAVAAAQSPAHASAPSASSSIAPVLRTVQDEWLLADVNEKVVLFSHEELDEGMYEFSRVLRRQDSDELSSDATDGMLANSIIESTDPRQDIIITANQQELNSMLEIAGQLLKRPAVQKELVSCMFENPGVLQFLRGLDPNMSDYLESHGLAAGGLLGAPSPDVQITEVMEPVEQVGGEHTKAPGPFDKAMLFLAKRFEDAGNGLGFIAQWIRDRVGDIASGFPQSRAEPGYKPVAEEGNMPKPVNKVEVFLTAAMVVAAAVVFFMVARRPVLLTRILRTRGMKV